MVSGALAEEFTSVLLNTSTEKAGVEAYWVKGQELTPFQDLFPVAVVFLEIVIIVIIKY